MASETLVDLLKEDECVDDENDVGERGSDDDASSSPLPPSHEAILRWITLLVDSHFVEFILGDDDRRFRLLCEAECFAHDVEGFFNTRDSLDALLGDMRQRRALYDDGRTLKTVMGPDDDYCIQVMDV